MVEVTVNEVLDIAKLSGGKLPDLFWDIENISGSELKVLKYVFENCLRLYTTVKIFPRGKDGSPRFWRGKEQMAADIGMSAPTFRNCVRHLNEIGVVTSMDGSWSDDEVHCIGLIPDYINSKLSSWNEKDFRCATLVNLNLLNLLYNNTTVVLVSNNLNLVNSPLDTNVSKLSETEKIYTTDIDQNTVDITKDATKIERDPITIHRKPISQIPGIFVITSAQNKLELLKNVISPREQEILDICEYYEYKCRQAIHSSGFRALGKDYRNHKNWKYLEKIHKLCQDNGWNYKVYLDSQFERVKYWNRKQKYPYLNQLFSENAIKCYNNYIKDLKENTSLDGDGKVTHGEVKDINSQIADDVVQDCDKVSSYLKLATKRRSTRDMNPSDLKMIYLSEHWTGLSTYYLASIPWFLQYLNQLPEEEFIKDLKSGIKDIQDSKSMLTRVTQIVQAVENEFEIPKTLVL